MTMTENIVAVDLGASSGRIILGHFNGKLLTFEVIHRFANYPVKIKNDLYWDVLKIFSEIKSGLRLAKSCCVSPIRSVGIDTWGTDFGLLDARGQLAGNPHCYRDERTNGMPEHVHAICPAKDIYRRTGIGGLAPNNTIYQLAGMLNCQDPALGQARNLLMMPDLINYLFTGQINGEYTICTTTQMYDPMQKSWITDILEKIGIPSAILPVVTRTGTILGPAAAYVNEEINLPRTNFVTVASHDTASAVSSVTKSMASSAFFSCGTWGIVGILSDVPIISDEAYHSGLTNEGTAAGKFRPAFNMSCLWLLQECQRAWANSGHNYTWAELAALAKEAKPHLAVINPDHHELFLVGDMPGKIALHCQNTGQEAPSSVGEFVRVIIESIALKVAWSFHKLEELTASRLDCLDAVGGGTNNDFLNQCVADAVNRPVFVGAAEGTAVGSILQQLLSQGILGSPEEMQAIINDSFPKRIFEPCHDSQWQESADLFARLFDQAGRLI